MRQDLKMGCGKIASQCARKIFKLVLKIKSIVFSYQFIVYFSGHMNSCLYYMILGCILFNYLIEYSIHEIADAATGMYAELMQRYVYANCGDLPLVEALKFL